MDAECTHDGSIKHITKFESWGWKTLERRVLDAERTDDLFNLQVIVLVFKINFRCDVILLFLCVGFKVRNFHKNIALTCLNITSMYHPYKFVLLNFFTF